MIRLLALAVLLPSMACTDDISSDILSLDAAPESARLRVAYEYCLIAAVERYEPVEPLAETIVQAARSDCSDDWTAFLQYFVYGGVPLVRIEQALEPYNEDLTDKLLELALYIRDRRE